MKREEANTMWVFTGVNTLAVLVLCAVGAGVFEPQPDVSNVHPVGLAERAAADGYARGLAASTELAYRKGYIDGRMHELEKRLRSEGDYPCDPCVGDK